MTTQVQTAPPASIPWDNPFSHVPITIPTRTAASPQWIKDLDEKGWAIIPKAISKDRADYYVGEAIKWLEGFKYGYKHDDPSTWRLENLPKNGKGGLYSAYSIAHAQWMWDAKTEPGVLSIFEQIWGTDKLTVSFDGGNLSVPLPKEQLEDGGAPWPHADQSPLKPELASIQGILNLLPNGPKDGGLTVMTGSTKYFTDLWEAFKDRRGPYDAHDHIKLQDEQMKWLEERGCKVEKPCLEPGDFIVWDSRTVHWGAAPEEQNHRMAVYTCYKPDAFLSDEARKLKIEYFNKGWCTSHDPCTFIAKASSTEPWNILFPYGRPTLSKRAQQAAGLVPYE